MPAILTKPISLRISHLQLDAYSAAANAHKISRHAWAIRALRCAANPAIQGTRPDISRVSRPHVDEPLMRTRKLTIKLPNADYAAVLIAHRSALLTLAQWCVIVLDCASGISYLYKQLINIDK